MTVPYSLKMDGLRKGKAALEEATFVLGAEPTFWEPGTFSGFLLGLSELILPIAAGIGAWIAWRGLSAWKKQMSGSSEYDLALRLLSAIYTVRADLKLARSPHKPVLRSGRPVEDEQYKKMFAFAKEHYEELLKMVRKSSNELLFLGLKAKAIWAYEELDESLRAIDRCISQVWSAVNLELLAIQEGTRLSVEFQKILWSESDEDEGAHDAFDQELEKAVVSAETILRKYIPTKKRRIKLKGGRPLKMG